jgi:hypothetical protein
VVDYFAVMVSAEVPMTEEELQAEAEAQASGQGQSLDSLDDMEDHPYHPDDADALGGRDTGATWAAAHPLRRRIGRQQFRYPKTDHADCPLPENVDWFIFPAGIAPIVRPTRSGGGAGGPPAAEAIRSVDRPATRRSVFVLSNAGGGTLGGKMYGCCLTAYRNEVEDGDEGDGM